GSPARAALSPAGSTGAAPRDSSSSTLSPFQCVVASAVTSDMGRTCRSYTGRAPAPAARLRLRSRGARLLVDIPRGLVRVRQDGGNFVPWRIKRDGMGALGRDHGLQELHGPGIKDINDPGIADGNIEMPKAGVEKNDVGTATQGAFVQHAS